MYPSRVASDGLFYFHLGTPTGMALQYNPGFNSLSVCVNTSSFTAHLTGGTAPIVVAGAPMTFSPALTTLAPFVRMTTAPAAVPTSYTWLWVLFGLGAAGVAGYYLLD